MTFLLHTCYLHNYILQTQIVSLYSVIRKIMINYICIKTRCTVFYYTQCIIM